MRQLCQCFGPLSQLSSLAAYNSGEKHGKSWNQPFFVIILQCQKEQTTILKTEKKTTLK